MRADKKQRLKLPTQKNNAFDCKAVFARRSTEFNINRQSHRETRKGLALLSAAALNVLHISVIVKPISANILSSSQPLSAERKYELVCETVGSRPHAKISWWKDNKKLENYTEKVRNSFPLAHSSFYRWATPAKQLKRDDRQWLCLLGSAFANNRLSTHHNIRAP